MKRAVVQLNFEVTVDVSTLNEEYTDIDEYVKEEALKIFESQKDEMTSDDFVITDWEDTEEEW